MPLFMLTPCRSRKATRSTLFVRAGRSTIPSLRNSSSCTTRFGALLRLGRRFAHSSKARMRQPRCWGTGTEHRWNVLFLNQIRVTATTADDLEAPFPGAPCRSRRANAQERRRDPDEAGLRIRRGSGCKSSLRELEGRCHRLDAVVNGINDTAKQEELVRPEHPIKIVRRMVMS
jgi:hypothetical protein